MPEKIKLDQKDRHLLFELKKNPRQSIHDLARKTKLNRDVVAYRMKRLENFGVIQKYITIIDFSKFGYHLIRLYIKLQNTTPEIEEHIIQSFFKQKNTLTVLRIDGRHDLSIGFLVKNLQEYQKSYENFLKQFRKYVAEKNFSIFLDYMHFHRNYLVEKKLHDYSAISTGSFQPFAADKKDIELLHVIKENARITLLELAKKIKMTPAGVKYKLRNLEKHKIIVAYKLLLDSAKIGYTYYKIDIELEDVNIIPALNEFITRYPHVIYRDIAVGGSDFEFDCEFRSQEELYALMDKLKQLFPQKIRHWFYFKALKTYKYS